MTENPYEAPTESIDAASKPSQWTENGELLIPRGTKEFTLPKICIYGGGTDDLFPDEHTLRYYASGSWVPWALAVAYSAWCFFVPPFGLWLPAYVAAGLAPICAFYFLTNRKIRITAYVQFGVRKKKAPSLLWLVAKQLALYLVLIGPVFLTMDWLISIDKRLPIRLILAISPWPGTVFYGRAWWHPETPLVARAHEGRIAIGGFTDEFHAARLESGDDQVASRS